MRQLAVIFMILSLLAVSCSAPFLLSPQDAATQTASAWTTTPTITITPSPTFTDTPTITPTPTFTATPSITPTFTLTLTPTISPSPTFDFPKAVVNKTAFCRYGPAQAYLPAGDLYAGDTGTVRGRFQYSTWLQIKFDRLGYYCWVAPSVVDVTGDIKRINFTTKLNALNPSIYYKAPNNVVATRNGKKVTITWDQVHMTSDKDRGYLLDIFVCQKGNLLWWPVSFPDQYTTSYTVEDGSGCAGPSGGNIYTVEKHGFSDPKTIPNWPPAP
jgi:hypothetical protein